MKLLVPALLIAASIPAVPTPPAAPRGCAPASARLRSGTSGAKEPNELTPAQAADVERAVAGSLARRRTPLRAAATTTTKIPVYFHVLHAGPEGNVSAAKINRQIAVLDASYGGRIGGYDTRFDFVLKAVTRTDNASWYANPEGYESAFKPRLHRGGAGALNLYSADLGDQLLGWATFPWRYRAQPKMDGVIIHADSLPGGPIPDFDRGFTATHEIGHWLGLYHTFQNGCQNPGDRVADTAPERDPTLGCPSGKDTCSAPARDPIHNYMDYSHDTCMNQFSKGQATRMHQLWATYRA